MDTCSLSAIGRSQRRCSSGEETAWNEKNASPDSAKRKKLSPTASAESRPHTRFSNKELNQMFDWLEYDEAADEMKCRVCREARRNNMHSLTGVTVNQSFENYLKHQESKGHKSAVETTQSKNLSNKNLVASQHDEFSDAGKILHNPLCASKSGQSHTAGCREFLRVVYCLPVVCTETLPIPNLKFRNLLQNHGMRAIVDFSRGASPSKVRENISKAFRGSFNLLAQELLQFDYLSVVKNELARPQKLLHFDSKTILSFAGNSHIYIILQQPPTNSGVGWEKLIFREKKLESLTDAEYKDVMLSVMRQLSSRNYKKDALEEETRQTDDLLEDYKLDEQHQLVFVGNCYDQLVLFTEQRREEAFKISHGDHNDLTTTFKNMYKSYYWNTLLKWVIEKVQACPVCGFEAGDNINTSIAVDKIVDDIVLQNSKQTQINDAMTNCEYTAYSLPDPVTSTCVQTPGNKGDSDDSSEEDETQYEEIQETLESDSRQRENSLHCAKVMSSMYSLQKKGMYCDFFIILLPSSFNGLSKPRVYGVHKVVFAAISDRIRNINKTSIKIGGKVTCSAVSNLIEYVYTGQLSGILNMDCKNVTLTSTAAVALDVEINDYIKKYRPDFVKVTTKITLNQHPGVVTQKVRQTTTEIDSNQTDTNAKTMYYG